LLLVKENYTTGEAMAKVIVTEK